MRKYELKCPNCGQKIVITVSEDNPDYIGVAFFDILDSSETIQIAHSLGYEFGAKGGE